MNAVKIKCRALMVGDWCCDKHGFPMRITNVGDDYAYATFEGNEGDPWEFDDNDDQPQPIVLTPEILEKNGWWYDGDDMWQHEEVDFYIENGMEDSNAMKSMISNLILSTNFNKYYASAV